MGFIVVFFSLALMLFSCYGRKNNRVGVSRTIFSERLDRHPGLMLEGAKTSILRAISFLAISMNLSILPAHSFGGFGVLSDIISARDALDNSMVDSENPIAVVKQIDYLLRDFGLGKKIKVSIAASNESIRPCAQSNGDKVIDDLYNLVEYFSVSNGDYSNRRLLISDSYPGQKKEFVKQGLTSVKSNLRQFIACFPSEVSTGP